MIKLAEMRAFSFGVARLKHANFLRETRDDCRFPGVEAIFALGFPMLRANRKLVASGTEFRMNHEMRDCPCAILHALRKRKAPHVQGPHAMGAFTIPRVSAVGH